jgi:predicted membrane channel-forming protein YqfA (hemolysin III family)
MKIREQSCPKNQAIHGTIFARGSGLYYIVLICITNILMVRACKNSMVENEVFFFFVGNQLVCCAIHITTPSNSKTPVDVYG